MTKRFDPSKPFDYYEVPERGFEVYSWCPTPQPTGPGTLDALIVALVRHRRDVWGDYTDEQIGAANREGS